MVVTLRYDLGSDIYDIEFSDIYFNDMNALGDLEHNSETNIPACKKNRQYKTAKEKQLKIQCLWQKYSTICTLIYNCSLCASIQMKGSTSAVLNGYYKAMIQKQG